MYREVQRMDEYSIIAPPFTLKFREMIKKELEDYNRWFLSQILERIVILEKAVQSTQGFEDWKADYRPESLDKLGEWFAGQVTKRRRTEEETKEIYAKAPDWFKAVEISDWELTNRTFSIAIDIGMYVSQVFLKSNPSLSWEHTTKGSKRWVDYGQPVLKGFGADVFNPTRMIVTLAYGIAHGKKSGTSLRELYEIWKKFI
jgi:hypothetical protein